MHGGEGSRASAATTVDRDRFRYSLPYPIAINYKRIGACPQNNATRLMYILKTAEMVARLLGIIALADVRSALGGRAAPPNALGNDFRRRFAAPSFGTWLDFLRRSLWLLGSCGREPFVPELRAFCFDGRGGPSESLRTLEEFVVLRNRFAHDQVRPEEWLQPREILTACATALPRLEGLLEQLLFLVNYPLALVSPLTVDKKRDTPPTFRWNACLITGCSDQFDVEQEDHDALCETGEVLLLRRDHPRYLNLDPFLGPVLLVYGESVAGKTSLVECGLRNAVPDEDAEFYTVRSNTDPLAAAKRLLAAGQEADARADLGELVRARAARASRTVVLVFDQFEEFFLFLPETVRRQFLKELAGAVEAKLDLRVIFVVREEYLAHMTEVERLLPLVFANRYWLRRMGMREAREAVEAPCRTGRKTNLRVCRETHAVVPVLPFPPPESVWAPEEACEGVQADLGGEPARAPEEPQAPEPEPRSPHATEDREGGAAESRVPPP